MIIIALETVYIHYRRRQLVMSVLLCLYNEILMIFLNEMLHRLLWILFIPVLKERARQPFTIFIYFFLFIIYGFFSPQRILYLTRIAYMQVNLVYRESGMFLLYLGDWDFHVIFNVNFTPEYYTVLQIHGYQVSHACQM